MRKAVLFLGLISAFYGWAQETNGFYGAKRFITFESEFSSPMIYNAVHSKQLLNSNFEKSNASIASNYRFVYSSVVDDEFAFSLEFGLTNFNLGISRNSNVYAADVYKGSYFTKQNIQLSNLKAPMVDAQTITIMPKCEFAMNPGLIPSGLFHQVGIGFNMTRILDHAYAIQATGVSNDGLNTPIQQTTVPANFYNYDAKSIKTFSLMYGVAYRVPLSKHVLFSYGVRYMLNFPPKILFHMNGESKDPKSADYVFSESEVREQMYVRMFQSAIHLNVGLVFAL